jgi:hypothetical protein
MSQSLIQESLERVSQDTKLVRLSFIMSFFHSLVVIGTFILSINNVLVSRFEQWLATSDALAFFLETGAENNLVTILIIAIIIFAIWYGIVYPIGQAALIRYLHDGKKSIRQAMGKGTNWFFPMFEFIALSGTFSFVNFILLNIRLYMLDIWSSGIVMVLVIILGLCVFATGLMWPYTKLIIILEDRPVFDAIKHSTSLAIQNFFSTAKFVLLEGVLVLRFLLNTIVIIGIPSLIIYAAAERNWLQYAGVKYFVIILVVLLALATVYINALIEAFFTTYWYTIYKRMKSEEQE